MFKFKARLISFILLIAMTICLMPSVTAFAALPAKPETVNYVALGDSIATGTVLGSSKITSYVAYFGEHLRTNYSTNLTSKVTNLAHDGDASNELLALLQSSTERQNDASSGSNTLSRAISSDEAAAVQAAVISAHVITISVGGNNLMRAANIPGFTTIDKVKAAKGVADFNIQWPLIIAKIRSYNPNAVILVNTVYNPYNTVAISGYRNDSALHTQVDGYLLKINELINVNKMLGAQKQYGVANVHDTFHSYATKGKMGSITYFYPFLSFLRNPHPNSTGQQLIKTGNVNSFTTY